MASETQITSTTSEQAILKLPLTPFDELLSKIRPMLKVLNVLINKDRILALMSNYDSRSEDWCHYARFDELAYTKNLIEDGGDFYNIMTMCWRPGQTSPIHGHEGAHCFIKVMGRFCVDSHSIVIPTKVQMLCGSLVEERHNYPDGTESDGDAKQGFNKRILDINNVHYIDDTIGVHKITNCDQRDAISLHIYAPPYRECRIFGLQWPRSTPNVDYSLSSDRHRHHQSFSIVRNYKKADVIAASAQPISGRVAKVEFYKET